MNPVRVKVCGLTDPSAALACARAGAEWIGLNFHPDSPRFVSIERAKEIASALSGLAVPAGLFVDRPVAEVIETCRRVNLGLVQLHGQESIDYLIELRRSSRTPLRVIRAFRLADRDSIEGMSAYLAQADQAGCPVHAVLVDAHVAGLPGGTGRTIPDALLDHLPAHPRLILAGGLTPENVASQVARVRPWMVDVAGGVESAPGVKDIARVLSFVNAAREIAGQPS